MFRWHFRNKQRAVADAVKNNRLTKSLEENIAVIEGAFADVDPVQYRRFENSQNSDMKYCLIFFDGVVDSEMIDNHILKPLMLPNQWPTGAPDADFLLSKVLQVKEISKSNDLNEIYKAICYGESLLLIENTDQALLLDTKSFTIRSVSEPESEKVLSGPREGFSEALLVNLSMMRRKLKTSDLKMKYYEMGKRTGTQICITYLDSIVNKNILAELYKRLDAIDIDGVLDANYITELIKDNARSLFRTMAYTERPDVVAGKLLEGRIAIFVDGTPVVLTVPCLFIENFQSNEDYYLNYYYTSFSRILRIIGFLLTIMVPALYIAIVDFHQEILPTPLMVSIANESHNVPLPAALEAFIMLIVFDILRETGIRMPYGVGNALSIVGALVVGQAAVEANLVASPMIIVVAISGITHLLTPKLNASVIFIRLALLLLSTMLGFFGLTIGLAFLFMHILSLRSFGISQLSRDEHMSFQNAKDIFIRAPWWQMRTRPPIIAADSTRQRNTQGGRQ